MREIKKKNIKLACIITSSVISGILALIWLRGGTDKLYLDSDIARDLSEISKLWIGQSVIWLGPRFSMGLHSSPFYYYLFYIPILISRGDAHSLIIFNVVISAGAIFLLGYLSAKKYGLRGLIAAIVLGFMPWWQDVSVHPGNGSTYAVFMLFFLTSLWFKLPYIIPPLFLGIAASMHPGAFFGIPFLIYEFIRQKVSVRKFSFSILVFLLPFLPLIIFEVITKGYWLSQWINSPGYGFSFAVNFENIKHFLSFSGVNVFIFLLLSAFAVYRIKVREKVWFVIAAVCLSVFSLLKSVPIHYQFGVMSIIWFSLILILNQSKKGWMLLLFFTFYLAFYVNPLWQIPKTSTRSISRIESTVEYLTDNADIGKNESLAVLTFKDLDTKTPQADDYRFFLRVKGFKVEEVSDYSRAEKLIIFVENPKLDWENWNTWETEQFGSRKLSEKYEINDIIMAVYTK